MSEAPRTSEVVEDDEEVPAIITEDFFNNIQFKIQNIVKDLREHEQYQLASEFIRLLAVSENLQICLKDEQGKNHELTERFIDSTGRIEAAMKISQNDQDTIEELRMEVTEAWNATDNSKLREVEMSEKLDGMREKLGRSVAELKRFERQFEDTDMSSLGAHKTTVMQECDRLSEEVRELNKRLKVQRAYSDELQKKLDDSVANMQEFFRQWDEATNETLSNQKKVESLRKKVSEMEDEMDRVNETMLHFKHQSETRHTRLQEREKQIATLRNSLDAARSEILRHKNHKAKMEEKLKMLSTEHTNMTHEILQMKNFLGLKEDESKKLIRENEKMMQQNDGNIRKIALIEKIVTAHKQEIQSQRNEIETAEKERDSIRRSNDVVKRELEVQQKKQAILMLDVEKRDEIINTVKQEKLALEEKKILMAQELKLAVEHDKRCRRNMKNLHSKLESVESEKSFLEKSLKDVSDDLVAKTQEIESMGDEMEETNRQLMNIRREHEVTIHQLKDARVEYQKCHEREFDIKDRWMKCKSQIDDTNNKLTGKIEEIANLQKKIQRFEKKVRELQRDLERSEDVLKLTRDEVKTIRLENKNQKDELRENDARFTKMKGQLDKILRERDLTANQMMRRTDESELLESKVSMLKMTIERSNGMYHDRLEDIKMMTNEIKNLRSQANVLKRALENTADMRHEVLKLHRKLNQERVKAKVLEQEMATPMNVHRWRKLTRFDSKRMDSLKKSQLLQRKLLKQAASIAKSEEIIEALQGKIALMEVELHKRKQAVDVHTKLMVTRSQLEVNTKRMKAAIAIKRASETDITSKDNAITQLQKELNDTKTLFFTEKREKCKLMEKIRKLKVDPENDEIKGKIQSLREDFKIKLLT